MVRHTLESSCGVCYCPDSCTRQCPWAVVQCACLMQRAVTRLSPAAPLVCCAAQVGIEECLHIEFEYDKARYHLKVRSQAAVRLQAAGASCP